MITIDRGPEPVGLAPVRVNELIRVRAIAATKNPSSEEVGTAYQVVLKELYQNQFAKCCYCEFKEQHAYNDVEHYRPKARAYRVPGCNDVHGYWWLAWTWSNLLFSCNVCNRSYKRDNFPLDMGSTPLVAEQAPPQGERPLLIDPSVEDPMDFIVFERTRIGRRVRWVPRPRAPVSMRAVKTISVLALDRPALLDHYGEHIRTLVEPARNRIEKAITGADGKAIRAVWRLESRVLLNSRLPFSALSHDALDYFFPAPERARQGLVLNRPASL